MAGVNRVSLRPSSEQLDSLIEKIGVLELDEFLRELLERSAAAIGVERVGYWSLDDDGNAIRRKAQFFLSSGSLELSPLTLDRADFPTYFAALHEGSSLIVSDDGMKDPRLEEFSQNYFLPNGIGAMLDAPVHRQGRLFGVICHEHVGGPREWTAGEIDFARYAAQWVALAVEIAQRRKTESALRESEARYRMVIDHTPTPTVVVDLETGRFTDANESAVRFYGVDRSSLLARGPADFSPEIQPDGTSSINAVKEKLALVRDGATPHFEWVHTGPDGREIPCTVHLARLPGENGSRLIAAVTDRTEQLRGEETIRRALENERELNELRSRFTSIVSHEFRTPLGIIMSAVELLRNYFDRLEPARRTELFEDIHGATRRMAALMEQVLVLGRADAGKLSFTPAPVDLGALCTKLTDESQSATVKRCEVELVTDGDLSGASADEPLLRHIFSNLLSNAAKYSPAGCLVKFRIARDGTDAVFEVEDQGIGIPEEDQARIFEAFQRAGNVGETAGSGLGLLITKRCVELHGGTISFVSASGKGTTFTVRLPVFA
jgi:PAS domain S-box-containing protein